MKKIVFFASFVFSISSSFGYEAQIRKGELPSTIGAMIEKANLEATAHFDLSDFYLIEDRNLATSRYQLYVQQSEQIPVAKTAIRIWSNKST